jgi:CubicO group peptidase (beta-lactamase class C family)
MKKITTFLLAFFVISSTFAQNSYFPPIVGNTWEKTDPSTLGWCTAKIDPLYTYLEQSNSKAFIVLKDGKIVLEKYFGTFTQDSLWYWASAGKTVTSSLIGIAQEEGLINIQDKSSKYLGKGWTSLPVAKEDLITIRNQLTMTTGLDETSECLDPTCLKYVADAGTRWTYHNAPYTMLDKVIEKASGMTFNQYYKAKIQNKIGMNGLFIKSSNNNINYSTPRSMARYGLLLANNGKWETNQIIPTKYLSEAINTSQNINLSYGYLWWLNGKASAMAPGSQLVFSGSLAKDAPKDMYSALGKNGQIINIVPSLGIVMIRMGNSDGLPVPITYNNTIWQKFNEVICKKTSNEDLFSTNNWAIFPNPTNDFLYFPDEKIYDISLFDVAGKEVFTAKNIYNQLNISNLKNGYYFGLAKTEGAVKHFKFLKL